MFHIKIHTINAHHLNIHSLKYLKIFILYNICMYVYMYKHTIYIYIYDTKFNFIAFNISLVEIKGNELNIRSVLNY